MPFAVTSGADLRYNVFQFSKTTEIQNYMKRTLGIALSLLISLSLSAQKVDYKSGLINVEGKDLAKVVKIKDKGSFGLTSTFELYSMSGEKLVIATIATDFDEDKSDNSSYFYRFSFLTANQVAIFTLNKLGAEKAFAKLIGQSGILVNDQVDPKQLSEFIATKSRNPKASIEYHLVQRNFSMPVSVKDGQVFQANTLVGRFKDITSKEGLDTYEFSLPDGLVVARASFTGGNNAKNCSVTTFKDKTEHSAAMPFDGTYGKTIFRTSDFDRNNITVRNIASWLVKQQYL